MKRILSFIFLLLSSYLYPQEEVYIIPIQGDIEPSLAVFIRQSLEKVKDDQSTIIFEIDTFGGRVDSALKITTLIGSIKGNRTIAYIPSNPESLGVSWSAGALISFSCSQIYMSEGTSIGAASPIYLTSEGSEDAGEKTISALRVQMASIAEKNGYPAEVALAMVDKDIELYEVNIDGIQSLKLKEDLSEDELKEGKEFLKKDKLLTLTAKQMELYNISKGTVRDLDDLLNRLGKNKKNVTKIIKTIPDLVIDLITSSSVLALLLVLGLITLYMEITSPGFGLLGAIGLISFSIIFAGGQLLGTLSSIELLLFIIGITLLIIEVFIIPGFGLTGVSGLLLIAVSILLSRQEFIIPKWDWQWEEFNSNSFTIFISFIISIIIISLLMVLFPKLSLFRKLILSPQIDKGEPTPLLNITNREGITVTQLRPIGKIKIDDTILEAKSDGSLIEKGRAIRVISHTGNRVVVEEISNDTSI